MLFIEIVLFATLGISGFTDMKYRKIVTVVLVISAILILAALGWLGLLTVKRLLGAVVVCGIFLSISIITGEKIGMGDGLLFGVVGLAVGLQRNIAIIMLCFGIAFIVAVFMFVSQKADRNTEIPLAPILLLSTALTLWGQPLL